MKNEMDMKIKIGARIKFLRTELGLTQEQLANKLPNVKGKSSIANYENGSNLPGDEVKLKLCEIFKCSLDYLMCKSDIKNPEQPDDPLGLAKIGFSMKDYTPPTETQKQQIKGLLEVIMKDNKKDVGDKKNESK